MKKKKVLIIDDEKDMILFLSTLMDMNGYQPVSADNSCDGMRKAEKERPFCIILNGMMSGEEGLSMYIDIKRAHKIKDIPVIMLCNIPGDTFLQYRKFKNAHYQGVPEPEAFVENPPDAGVLTTLVKKMAGE
jgi:PleD family two-component response regulator